MNHSPSQTQPGGSTALPAGNSITAACGGRCPLNLTQYGFLFSVRTIRIYNVAYNAFPPYGASHARCPLSRSPCAHHDGSGSGAAGLCRTGTVGRSSSRSLPSAWLRLVEESMLLGPPHAAHLSLLWLRLGRQPPGPLRSRYSPEPLCRGAGPVRPSSL
jgi:hypothetical protein